MKGEKGYTLRGCASTHFILLELLLRTFWAQQYTHCAGLRSVCHELQAYPALFPFGHAHEEVVGWLLLLAGSVTVG